MTLFDVTSYFTDYFVTFQSGFTLKYIWFQNLNVPVMLKLILLETFEDDINRPLCNFSFHFVIFEMLSYIGNVCTQNMYCVRGNMC
jgi:hypothetical protein